MKLFKKATSLLLTSILFLTAGITAFSEDYYDEDTEKDIIVYFTNDVHNAYEQTDTAIGYASLAADIKSRRFYPGRDNRRPVKRYVGGRNNGKDGL